MYLGRGEKYATAQLTFVGPLVQCTHSSCLVYGKTEHSNSKTVSLKSSANAPHPNGGHFLFKKPFIIQVFKIP